MVTVFTPTYNRKELLKRVYESLRIQTSREFQWLIVDDGSTDNTRQQVEKWVKKKNFSGEILQGTDDTGMYITYLYQENGGKMRAHNRGTSYCNTELFVCVDSDDYLTENAVELIIKCWKESRGNNIAGIAAHKGTDLKNIFSGAEFPGVSKSTLGGLYSRGFKGETTLIFDTEIIKKFPFPEFFGEKYVPEDVIYDRIDREYELIILPKIVTICELMESGYSDSVKKLRDNNPYAWYLYYEQKAKWTRLSILKIKYISHYICFGRYLKKNMFKDTAIGKGYMLMGLPGAVLLALADKK